MAVTITVLPSLAAEGQINGSELLEELSDLLRVQIQPVFRAERAGDIKHSRGDGSFIAQRLLFAPATTLREGLRNLLAAS